jgi:hypothetical protein
MPDVAFVIGLALGAVIAVVVFVIDAREARGK